MKSERGAVRKVKMQKKKKPTLTQIPPLLQNFPGPAPGLISWEQPLIDNPRNPVSMETASAAPGGLARGLLWMRWRHSSGARESAPKTERERGREREREGRMGEKEEKWNRTEEEEKGRGETGCGAALHRRALGPIHHLPVRHQSLRVDRNEHICGGERKTMRRWKNPIAPDVDTDCRRCSLY